MKKWGEYLDNIRRGVHGHELNLALPLLKELRVGHFDVLDGHNLAFMVLKKEKMKMFREYQSRI